MNKTDLVKVVKDTVSETLEGVTAKDTAIFVDATIKAIQEYRKRHDNLVECVAVTRMPTKYGEFMAHCYVNKLNGEHHVALIKGYIGDLSNLFCRVHSECLT